MPKVNGQDLSEKEFYNYVRGTMQGQTITDYPKMLYKPGGIGHNEHHHQGEPLLIAGRHEAVTLLVDNEDEELAALADGWATTLAEKKEARRGNAA